MTATTLSAVINRHDELNWQSLQATWSVARCFCNSWAPGRNLWTFIISKIRKLKKTIKIRKIRLTMAWFSPRLSSTPRWPHIGHTHWPHVGFILASQRTLIYSDCNWYQSRLRKCFYLKSSFTTLSVLIPRDLRGHRHLSLFTDVHSTVWCFADCVTWITKGYTRT